jgi:hypothetical protein
MRQRNFTYLGNTFDLSHLVTSNYQAHTLHQPKGVTVKVVYSCHCFTETKSHVNELGPTYTEENEQRYFSIARYHLSCGLPQVISEAIKRAQNFKVYQRTDRNGAFNYAILQDPNSAKTYCIFFDVAKRNYKGATYILMTIKSAYIIKAQKSSSRDKTNLGTVFDKIMGRHPRQNHKKKHRKK